MPAPLSQDLRRRFRRYVEDGLSAREAARRLLISAATGVRLARRVRRDEPLVAQKCGRPRGWGKLGPHKALLIELVEQDPDITMAELKGALAEAEGVHVHEGSLSRALRRMGYPGVYGAGPWTIRNSLLGDGFLCGPGWYPLIERLSADLAEIVRQEGLRRFRAVQVKEKFGGLRFYTTGGNERTLARIAEAAQEAEHTCEGCGAPGHIRSIDGWLTTICDDCRVR